VRKLITLSVSPEAERFSLSDFPLAGFDEKGVSELEYALAETGESTNSTDDNDNHERQRSAASRTEARLAFISLKGKTTTFVIEKPSLKE
jgi:hypothetical protein